jgi:hypothetical protein
MSISINYKTNFFAAKKQALFLSHKKSFDSGTAAIEAFSIVFG